MQVIEIWLESVPQCCSSSWFLCTSRQNMFLQITNNFMINFLHISIATCNLHYICNIHGNLSLYLFLCATTHFLAKSPSSSTGILHKEPMNCRKYKRVINALHMYIIQYKMEEYCNVCKNYITYNYIIFIYIYGQIFTQCRRPVKCLYWIRVYTSNCFSNPLLPVPSFLFISTMAHLSS